MDGLIYNYKKEATIHDPIVDLTKEQTEELLRAWKDHFQYGESVILPKGLAELLPDGTFYRLYGLEQLRNKILESNGHAELLGIKEQQDRRLTWYYPIMTLIHLAVAGGLVAAAVWSSWGG